jgi:hypothetical protein
VRPVEIIPGIGVRKRKENDVRGEFKYDTLDML